MFLGFKIRGISSNFKYIKDNEGVNWSIIKNITWCKALNGGVCYWVYLFYYFWGIREMQKRKEKDNRIRRFVGCYGPFRIRELFCLT